VRPVGIGGRSNEWLATSSRGGRRFRLRLQIALIGRLRPCDCQLGRAAPASASAQGNWPGFGPAGGRSNRRWEAQPRDPGRPGSRRPGTAGHRERAGAAGAAARVASVTTCSLSWPAAVPCACTSRSWRRRSRWPGLAPGRQSGQVSAGAAVRYLVATFGGPPSRLPRTWLGSRGAASLRCLCGWGALAGWGAMDG
jgi:hypothetical protein